MHYIFVSVASLTSIIHNLVETVFELKNQMRILTSSVNTLVDKSTFNDDPICSSDLPESIQLPVKSITGMDDLDEQLKEPATQLKMVQDMFLDFCLNITNLI